MDRHILKAFDESGGILFVRLVTTLEDGLKATLNAPLTNKVSYIEYRDRKYAMTDIYRLADRSLKSVNTRDKIRVSWVDKDCS